MGEGRGWPRARPTTLLLPPSPRLQGPPDTVYEGGTFTLAVTLPPRYPLEPPRVVVRTPVHHPHVDAGGRVCLDTLSLPPKGAWTPSLNVATVLATVRQLLAAPNGDDGLDPGVCHQFRHARGAFDDRARAMTREHATDKGGGSGSGSKAEEGRPAATALAAPAPAAGRLAVKRPRDENDAPA